MFIITHYSLEEILGFFGLPLAANPGILQLLKDGDLGPDLPEPWLPSQLNTKSTRTQISYFYIYFSRS